FISVCGRLLTPDDSPQRCWWAVAQLTIGISLFSTGHITAYLFAAIKSDKIGPMAIVFKPIEVWEWSIRQLPDHAWRLWIGVWGMMACLCALVIVGGINYSAMFEK